MNALCEFCQLTDQPTTIFSLSQHDFQHLMDAFVFWLRDTRHIDGQTINMYLSHVADFARSLQISWHDSIRSHDIKQVLKSMKRQDIETKGPHDSHCKIPIGCELVQKTLLLIRAKYSEQPLLRLSLECALILYYLLGFRVFEVIDKYLGQPSPSSPRSHRPLPNHSLTQNDILIQWKDDPRVYRIEDWRSFPNPIPYRMCLGHHSTKNWPEGPPRMTAWCNPNGPNNPFCGLSIIADFAKCAQRTEGDITMGRLFPISLTHDILEQLLKEVANKNNIDPSRIYISGIRSGTASVHTSDYDQRLQKAQQHQLWTSASGPKPYVHSTFEQGHGAAISLYDESINTCPQTHALYCPYYTYNPQYDPSRPNPSSGTSTCAKR